MTKIDFYILPGDSEDARLATACRIADKAVQRDRHVFICPASPSEAKKLDDLLWTFSQGSFVPHALVSETSDAAPVEPVQIGDGAGPLGERWDLLINLSSEVPDFFSRFTEVAEVVDAQAERRNLGRERYRFYRDRGYPLNTHQV